MYYIYLLVPSQMLYKHTFFSIQHEYLQPRTHMFNIRKYVPISNVHLVPFTPHGFWCAFHLANVALIICYRNFIDVLQVYVVWTTKRNEKVMQKLLINYYKSWYCGLWPMGYGESMHLLQSTLKWSPSLKNTHEPCTWWPTHY